MLYIKSLNPHCNLFFLFSLIIAQICYREVLEVMWNGSDGAKIKVSSGLHSVWFQGTSWGRSGLHLLEAVNTFGDLSVFPPTSQPATVSQIFPTAPQDSSRDRLLFCCHTSLSQSFEPVFKFPFTDKYTNVPNKHFSRPVWPNSPVLFLLPNAAQTKYQISTLVLSNDFFWRNFLK